MQDAGAEFVKWIDVQKLKRDPINFEFIASENERALLAKGLGIVGIDYLKAKGTIEHQENSKLLDLSAKFKTNVTQSCVVSLEPVTQEIELEFTVCYTSNKNDVAVEEAEYVVGMEEKDLPWLIEEGKIDVVHAVVEQIALALDPYPRAEEAKKSVSAEHLQQSDEEAEGGDREVHKPFANLRELMNKK